MNKTLAVLAAATILAGATGCVMVVTPGGGSHPEWAGDYAKSEAARHDRDRGIALRVRKALNDDSELRPLKLKIFVDRGEVSLCGGSFPNAKLRARALAIVGAVEGVEGVDTDCGGN